MPGSKEVDENIAQLDDWRGETLSRLRELTQEALPDVVEEIKWRKASSPDAVSYTHLTLPTNREV